MFNFEGPRLSLEARPAVQKVRAESFQRLDGPGQLPGTPAESSAQRTFRETAGKSRKTVESRPGNPGV